MSVFGNLFGGMLRQLYTFGSLRNTENGFEFQLKNRLSSAEVKGIEGIRVDGEQIPLDQVVLIQGDEVMKASEITEEHPVHFPTGAEVTVRVINHPPLTPGNHSIGIALNTSPFGVLKFKVEDTLEEVEAG